jgi:hypothetical protein
MKRLKAISLFFAAPFIGLAYAVALPFVGLYMFINLGVERSAIELNEALKMDEEEIKD